MKKRKKIREIEKRRWNPRIKRISLLRGLKEVRRAH
jgi:hypothetical protein